MSGSSKSNSEEHPSWQTVSQRRAGPVVLQLSASPEAENPEQDVEHESDPQSCMSFPISGVDG